MGNTLKNAKDQGFTLAELAIVIIVVGILAAVSIVGYGAWQNKIANDQVKSDLTAAASAMESARTFNENGYPAAIPASFKASQGVTISGGSPDGGKTFCIGGVSGRDTTIRYKIVENGTVSTGNCPVYSAPTAPVLVRVLGQSGNADEYGNAGWSAPTSNGGSPITSYRVRIVYVANDSMCVATPDVVKTVLASQLTGSWLQYVYGYSTGFNDLQCDGGYGNSTSGIIANIYVAAVNGVGTGPELSMPVYGYTVGQN